jgi:hypothetical protein
MIVIWVLTGAGYPWPLWVIGPWGAIMAGRWIVGSHPDGHGRRREVGAASSQLDQGQLDRGQVGRGDDTAGGPPGNG